MNQLGILAYQLKPMMENHYRNADEIEKIIMQQSMAAAAAGLAGGFLPGVAGIIATVTSAGSIWMMYGRICQALGIRISRNILKALGSAVLSNIVTQLAGVLAVELVASFIPGAAVVASAVVCYGVTYLAGFLFMKLLVNVFKAGRNPEKMTAEELADAIRQASRETDCKGVFKTAQAEAKAKIKSGEIRKEV